MTKPKKWYIDDGLELVGSDGENIRKPNAKQSLGVVINVLVPSDIDIEKPKMKEDYLLVSFMLNVSGITS